MADINMAVWLVQNLNGNIPMGMQTPVTVKYAQSSGRGGKGGGSYGPAAGGMGVPDNRSAPYGLSPAPLASTPAFQGAAIMDGMTAPEGSTTFAETLGASAPMGSTQPAADL